MFSVETVVSDLVVERPGRSRVFEELGIDYCCGGGVPLAEARAGVGLDPGEVIAELERDTHYHVFKENSILFPKAAAAEAALAGN